MISKRNFFDCNVQNHLPYTLQNFHLLRCFRTGQAPRREQNKDKVHEGKFRKRSPRMYGFRGHIPQVIRTGHCVPDNKQAKQCPQS